MYVIGHQSVTNKLIATIVDKEAGAVACAWTQHTRMEVKSSWGIGCTGGQPVPCLVQPVFVHRVPLAHLGRLLSRNIRIVLPLLK